MRSTLLLLLLPLQPCLGQWRLSLAHGSASASGFSQEGSGSTAVAFLPDQPRTISVTIGKPIGDFRLGLEARRTTADLALRGAGTSIVTTSAIRASGGAVELSRRLLGNTRHASIEAGVALLVERWSFAVGGGDARWRPGGRGMLSLELPLSGRWSATVRGEAMLSESIFRVAELPEGYRARMGRRRGVVLGINWTTRGGGSTIRR